MPEKKHDIEATAKEELRRSAERTYTGPVFSPRVDILETNRELTVLADMPGVRAGDLVVDLNDDVLRITGTVETPEGPHETGVLREYDTGAFERTFTLSQTIDRNRIAARLENGVLRLELPKVEKAQPRRIQVQAS